MNAIIIAINFYLYKCVVIEMHFATVDGPLASMLKEKVSASKVKAFSGNKGSYQNEEKKYKVAEHLFS